MKILLILASDIHYRSHGRRARRVIVNLEPVTLTTLAALVPPELDAEVRIIDEGLQRGEYKGEMYDVVGISCCTAASERAYALAKYWKLKGAFVVLGGIHPTLNPDEAARHADAVVVGAGEDTWPQLLRDFAQDKAKALYQQSECPLQSPIPNRDIMGKGYVRIPSVIANRGCTFGCDFCTIQSMWRQRQHKRPIAEVVDEIRSLDSKYMVLLDPGPSSDMDYTLELYDALRSLKVWWACQATVDTAFNAEMLETMRRSGCVAAFVGFETFSEQGLQSHKKTWNKVDRYKDAVYNFHEKGISLVGGFIMGFDTETRESLAEFPRLVEELGVDLPRCAILTPYPGTPLYNKIEAEGRLHHKRWHLYDGFHSVYQPKNMESHELEHLFHKNWSEIYKMDKIMDRIRKNKIMSKWLVTTINLGIRAYVKRIVKYYPRPYEADEYLKYL